MLKYWGSYTFNENGKIKFIYSQNAFIFCDKLWSSTRSLARADRDKVLFACPKVTGYIIRGSNSTITFSPPFLIGINLKVKNLLSKFFSLRVYQIRKVLRRLRKANRKS